MTNTEVTHAPAPTRSVMNGSLIFSGVKIPLKVYSASEEFSLGTGYFHEDCGSKASAPYYCKECEEDISPIAAIPIVDGDDVALLPVTTENRDILLDRLHPLIVKSSHRLTALPAMLSRGDMHIRSIYMVSTTDKSPNGEIHLDVSSQAICVLLDRLRVRKSFLLLEGSLGKSMNRQMILLPNGLIYTLSYVEEIRESHDLLPNLTQGVHRSIATMFNNMLDDLPTDFSKPSLSGMTSRINSWIMTCRQGSKVSTDA